MHPCIRLCTLFTSSNMAPLYRYLLELVSHGFVCLIHSNLFLFTLVHPARSMHSCIICEIIYIYIYMYVFIYVYVRVCVCVCVCVNQYPWVPSLYAHSSTSYNSN